MNLLNPAGFSAPPKSETPSARVGGSSTSETVTNALPYVLGALGIGLGIYALSRDDQPKREQQSPWHYGA